MNTVDLNSALQAAETELDELAKQAREAYRRFRDLESQQTAKADEIRELKRQIRENAPEDRDS